MSGDYSTLSLLLRLTVSFALIGVLLAGFVWLARRRRLGRVGGVLAAMTRGAGRSAAPVEVLARQTLTRTSSVVLLRAGRRVLLVGVGETGVAVLGEGDDLDPPVPDEGTDDAPTGQAAGHRSPQRDPRTGRAGAHAPDRTRTGLLDTLRERSVRRG